MLRQTVAWFLAPVVLATVLPAQIDEADKLDAVKDFKKYFRTYKEPAERVAAVETLIGNECVPAAQELVRLLNHKEDSIRKTAMRVISTYKDGRTFVPFIEQLPDMKDPDRRGLLIEVMGRAGIYDALPAMRQVALEDSSANAFVKVKIAQALERMKAEGSEAVLLAFLKDKAPSVRMAALDCVGTHRVTATNSLVVRLLKDSLWQVQAAAIDAAGKVRIEAAIDPLIDVMSKGGRLKEQCADALFLITTKDYALDPDRWRKGIAKWRSLGWRIPTDEEVAKMKAARKKNLEYYGLKGQKMTFAKISTTSTRVLFIIDISGSMEDHVVEHEKFDSGYESFQKLEIVKTELRNTVKGLSRNTLFNIVAFATDVKTWKRGLVPANIVNKSSADAFVKRQRPIGGSEAVAMASVGLKSGAAKGKTNTYKALMYAFGIDPDKQKSSAVFTGGATKSMVKKRKLDTVFFLSDGKPSHGKLVDTNEILKEVTEINKMYRIVFHTIAIGQFQKEFLRELARQNGGIFVDLGS
ncbi:MAG: HEAT repeat domain-containing protein [Planctomycetota bacterium]|jgi:HEAT repeat protein